MISIRHEPMKNQTDNPTMDDGALFEQYLEEGNYALAFEVLKRLAEKSRERKLPPISRVDRVRRKSPFSKRADEADRPVR